MEKHYFLFVIICVIFTSCSWANDAYALLSSRGLIVEYDCGYSYARMYRLNRFYIDDWAKTVGLFEENFHSNMTMTPSLGLVYRNHIVSISGTFYHGKNPGTLTDIIDSTTTDIFMFTYLRTVNISYRRMFPVNQLIFGLGLAGSFGEGTTQIGRKRRPPDNVGLGGGWSVSGELNYNLFKQIIIGVKISGNFFLTEALWHMYPDEKAINLDYTGFSAVVKIGLLNERPARK